MYIPKRILIIVLCVVVAMAGWFVLSTRMSKPTNMALYQPAEAASANANTLHFILVKDEVIYYQGDLTATTVAKKTDMAGVKDLILAYKGQSKDSSITVIIKPTSHATYRNTVDILDEMATNEVKQYALVELTESEKKLLQL